MPLDGPPDDRELLGLINDQAPTAVDPRQKQTVKDEENALDRAQKIAQLKGIIQDISERKKYAGHIFLLLSAWLAIVAYIILAQGFGVGIHAYGRFHLADSVIIALLTTTTATVVGVFLIVANYLFPKR